MNHITRDAGRLSRVQKLRLLKSERGLIGRIARSLKPRVTQSLVSHVLHGRGKSRRVEQAIERELARLLAERGKAA